MPGITTQGAKAMKQDTLSAQAIDALSFARAQNAIVVPYEYPAYATLSTFVTSLIFMTAAGTSSIPFSAIEKFQ